MSRPRLTNHHLPKGIQFRHGSYYRIVDGKWIHLGKTLDMDAELPPASSIRTEKRQALLEVCVKQVAVARANAKKNSRGRRRMLFELVKDDVRDLLENSNWRCAVTGSEFSYEVVNGKRPFAPSIDRIDSSRGYVKDNCRIVCVAANYAMNVWGDQVLHAMLDRMRIHKTSTVRPSAASTTFRKVIDSHS